MTVHIEEIVDPDEIERLVERRYVTRRFLAGTDVAVLNYTAKAARDDYWTTETLRCRGLVYDVASGEVLARPFEKFFDLGRTAIPTGGPMEASEKFDGSLGILYRRPDGRLVVTTRGDPNSWQAEAATRLLGERYVGVEPPEGVTWLVEIVLPENRIVVDYGERRELVALAAIDMATGRDLGVPDTWPGPKAERLDVTEGSLGDLLAAMEQRGDCEGLVIHWPDENLRAKVKLSEYKALHRLLYATSTVAVWELLARGEDPLDVLARDSGVALPEEVRAFVARHATAMRDRHDGLVRDARTVVAGLDPDVRAKRRDAALAIQAAALKSGVPAGLCFLVLDGREDELEAAAWRAVRPHPVEVLRRERAE
jgi:RNA ligase